MARKKGHEHYILDDAGKSTALTPAMADALVAETRAGRWPQMAAVRCNLDPRTLLRWLERGIEEDAIEPYRTFTQEFLRAEADFCAEMEDVLMKSALGKFEYEPGKPRPNPETARYLLERRMAVLWGGRALSGLEVVSQASGRQGIRKKALEFLESLSAADKQRARDRGLMLPDGGGLVLTEGES